jgi:predicted ATPase
MAVPTSLHDAVSGLDQPKRPGVFLRRVALHNYKSIAKCSVELGPLNFLVGPNGSGKSNFLDALAFTADCLNTTVEHALRERGGIAEVRRRSSGHPNHFGVRLEWSLPSGESGSYAFRIGAKPKGAFEVQKEVCRIHPAELGKAESFYEVELGRVVNSSETMTPAHISDRLYLVAMSGNPAFRPFYDALLRMGFYNLNPRVIREPQDPDRGEVLASDGRNLASVLKLLSQESPTERLDRIVKLLSRVVPGITGVACKPIARKETLEFLQKVSGSANPWRFDAESMSDGTLRILGVLVALFQPRSPTGLLVPVVGIEEPETALHPGAAFVLREALFEASRSTQVLVTSHSPELLDDKSVTDDLVISVESRDGETVMGPIDAVSRGAVCDRLFTVGELLRVDQLRVGDSAGDGARQSLFPL